MRIIVTRPEPDATEFAARLSAMGHEAIVAPLLVTETRPIPKGSLAAARALVMTSRNAVRALAHSSDELARATRLPLFVVGPGTAAEARAAGFADVRTGAGDGAALAELVRATFPAGGPPIVHLAGEELAYDLAGDLARTGHAVDVVAVYRMRDAEELPVAATTALRQETGSAVILMSPRTAATYARVVSRAGLEDAARRTTHLCLSHTVAKRLESLGPVSIEIATRPTGEEMLALVTRMATQSR